MISVPSFLLTTLRPERVCCGIDTDVLTARDGTVIAHTIPDLDAVVVRPTTRLLKTVPPSSCSDVRDMCPLVVPKQATLSSAVCKPYRVPPFLATNPREYPSP